MHYTQQIDKDDKMTIKVSQLLYYPVKSLKGVSVDKLEVDGFGPKWDRRFMLVDEKGRFITQRQCPVMNQVSAWVEDEKLIIKFQSQQKSIDLNDIERFEQFTQVKVWDDTVHARMINHELNHWLSHVLKRNVNLCFMDENTHRQVDLAYSKPGDRASFADGFPFLIISEASVNFLSDKLSHQLSIERFRPNIVVSGCDPFAEDQWTQVEINGIAFDIVKPCSRCVIPTLDLNTSEKQPEVMQAMLKYRKQGKHVMMGQNAIHSAHGLLNIGDEIQVN